MSEFRGKINISRDLRKNKQVIISHYDMVDVLFILLGVGSGILVVFLLGFFFKVVDEFSAIFIGFIPTIIIVTLGFRRVAGIRYIAYLMMKNIDKKRKSRLNTSLIVNTVDSSINSKRTNKKAKREKNVNIDIVKKDKKQAFSILNIFKYDSKQNNYIKFIIPIEVSQKDVKRLINEFLSYENAEEVSYRIQKDKDTKKAKHILLLNIKYKDKNELYENILNKFINRTDIQSISIEDIEKWQDDIEKGKYIVYMLHLYDKKIYRQYISKVKNYCEVVSYIKKVDNKKYINTYLLVEDEEFIEKEKEKQMKLIIKDGYKENNIELKKTRKKKKKYKIDKVIEISKKYDIKLNDLSKEQGIAKVPINYYMQNLYNAYRKYD